MSQKALNRVLTVPDYSTRRELSGTTLKFSRVLCASSYGHFIARKEFWPQCHILRFCNTYMIIVSLGKRSSRWGNYKNLKEIW